jgi:hypothetical protein
MFNTPVLFLVFNRPDTTRVVFDRIRKIQPKYLFVAADGPRKNKPDDIIKCKAARKIIDEVDWDCELKTLFRESNLGCKIAVSSAIDWFFENVEEGIILEDDCLPDLSFFGFCELLLEKYRNDKRIMHIGGANFQDGKIRGDGSYYFSKISHVWGWATWKRAWDKYNVNIPDFQEFVNQNTIAKAYPHKDMQKFFLKNFEMVFRNERDTWDYQWVYTLVVNNGLSIIPNKNLISNIGFDSDATHTTLKFHPLANKPVEKIDEIIHPSRIISNTNADVYTFKNYFILNKFVKLKLWFYRLLKK